MNTVLNSQTSWNGLRNPKGFEDYTLQLAVSDNLEKTSFSQLVFQSANLGKNYQGSINSWYKVTQLGNKKKILSSAVK